MTVEEVRTETVLAEAVIVRPTAWEVAISAVQVVREAITAALAAAPVVMTEEVRGRAAIAVDQAWAAAAHEAADSVAGRLHAAAAGCRAAAEAEGRAEAVAAGAGRAAR